MKPSFPLALALIALTAATSFDAATAACGSCGGCLWTYSGGSSCYTNPSKAECDAWGAAYAWCGAGGSTTTQTPATATPTATPTVAPTTAPSTSCSSCKGCLWTYPGGTQCLTTAAKAECDAWGTGYAWCSSTTTTTAAPTTAPSTTTAPTTAPSSSSFALGPYTLVGAGLPLASTMTSLGLNVVTLAFANGECGSENWGTGNTISGVVSIINTLVAAKKKYIISTGGESGVFTCSSDANFLKFIKTYQSAYLIGIDFDIESTQTRAQVDSLVLRTKNAQATYPNLRYSFTISSFAKASGGDPFLWLGDQVINSIKVNGLTNYLINPMTMCYTDLSQCVVSGSTCDMGASANQVAKNLHDYYSIPYSKIEVTPMIGGNCFPVAPQHEFIFTLNDVATVSNFAKANGLAGVHYWSLERDNDCAPGAANWKCNTYGVAGLYGFTKKFLTYFQ